jgi:hypothetical protein
MQQGQVKGRLTVQVQDGVGPLLSGPKPRLQRLRER